MACKIIVFEKKGGRIDNSEGLTTHERRILGFQSEEDLCGVVWWYSLSTVTAAKSRLAARDNLPSQSKALRAGVLPSAALTNKRRSFKYHTEGSPSRWPRAAAGFDEGGEDMFLPPIMTINRRHT